MTALGRLRATDIEKRESRELPVEDGGNFSILRQGTSSGRQKTTLSSVLCPKPRHATASKVSKPQTKPSEAIDSELVMLPNSPAV